MKEIRTDLNHIQTRDSERASNRDIISQVENSVRKSVLETGISGLIVGLSGGADSTALLLSLLPLVKEGKLEITAVHCNFGLRGEESMRDEEFCRKLCRDNRIKLIVFDCPVSEWHLNNKGSDEMACREMRYERFRKIISEKGADGVAIAHNADDQAETFFLNLMRSAGSAGLKGMRIFRDSVFRPFLDLPRRLIEEYLQAKRQAHVTDSTNQESIYRRNYIRNKIFPIIEKEWPEAKGAIRRTMEILDRENRIVEWTLENIMPEGTLFLSRDSIPGFPDPEALFRRLLVPHGAGSSLIHNISLTSKEPYAGRKWNLPGGILWELRDGWEVRPFSNRGKDKIDCKDNESQFTLRKEKVQLNNEILDSIRKTSNSVCWIDSDDGLELRRWKKGDRIHPFGMKGSKLVSDILTEARIPNSEKEQYPVLALCNSQEIIWIPGLKRSRLRLIDKGSTAIKLTIKEGD